MFVEKFTKQIIEQYRSLMPIKINGKNTNYSICCNGVYHNPEKNRDNSCLFIKDFTCVLSYTNSKQKIKLNKLHQKAMSKIFKDKYLIELDKYNNLQTDLTL